MFVCAGRLHSYVRVCVCVCVVSSHAVVCVCVLVLQRSLICVLVPALMYVMYARAAGLGISVPSTPSRSLSLQWVLVSVTIRVSVMCPHCVSVGVVLIMCVDPSLSAANATAADVAPALCLRWRQFSVSVSRGLSHSLTQRYKNTVANTVLVPRWLSPRWGASLLQRGSASP